MCYAGHAGEIGEVTRTALEHVQFTAIVHMFSQEWRRGGAAVISRMIYTRPREAGEIKPSP
jgi:hypothetical protein